MAFPLVSVYMPVYNAEKYLKDAIDSVLSQTYSHFELIIVNDASTDHSKDIILSYTDKRIRYYENEINLGIAKTRNKCIERAKGKYIAVLDNDDIALPGRLQNQVAFLDANSEYGLCGSFYEQIDENGESICKMRLPVSNTEIITYLLFDNCFCNSSVMVLAELLKSKPYSENFDMIEDYYFLYLLSKSVKLSILPSVETQYRIHGSNTSLKKAGGMREVRKKMDKIVLKDLGISYSEDEFEIHTDFFTAHFGSFNNNSRLYSLESWLLKLYNFLDSVGGYDRNVVRKIFIRRWILLFNRNGRITYRLFFNRIFLRFPVRFFVYFFELLFEKYSKRRSAA